MEIISLRNRLFTDNPDKVFAKTRKVSEGLLDELYFKYTIKEWNPRDLQELYQVRTKKPPINRKNLCVWLKKVEVYRAAQRAIEIGAKQCTPQFFGENAEFVLKQIYGKKK